MCCQSSGQWKFSAQQPPKSPAPRRHYLGFSQRTQVLILTIILLAVLQTQTVAAGAGDSLSGECHFIVCRWPLRVGITMDQCGFYVTIPIKVWSIFKKYHIVECVAIMLDLQNGFRNSHCFRNLKSI